MSNDLRARVREFVGAHHTMSVATDGPEGLWAATVLYVNDGTEFFFMSDRDTRHTKNILATGRAAVTINGDVASWQDIRGIQFAGEATVVDKLSQKAHVLGMFLTRYPFVRALFGGAVDPIEMVKAMKNHTVVQIHPARVFFTDHSTSMEREELATEQLA